MSDSPLRQAIEEAAFVSGLPLKDLTVLAAQNDPFRIDTDARHRDGEWLAITARDLGLGTRKIHLRGLHYMVLGRKKPNGVPYANTDEDWTWLSENAGKAARWLRYLPFDQIVDQRNSPPAVRIFEEPQPRAYLNVGVNVEIPNAEDIAPEVYVRDFHGVQPYKLVMIGEKSSLADVLAPIAQARQADLYLPTGEPSDTMLHQMARIGADDGRPMVVFYFSDADPAGWQMPISVGRKLMALKVLLFEDLEFQVRRVALTPEQVRRYGLPSTPLKETEKRADKWQAAYGVEQTEIDALASLQPELLKRIARKAMTPFYDTTLDGRVSAARGQWLAEAQAVVDAQMDSDHLDRIRADAAEKLAALQVEIDAINAALQVDTDNLDLPEIVVPEAENRDGYDDAYHRDVEYGVPLLDSRWDFDEQCHALIESKGYRDGAPC